VLADPSPQKVIGRCAQFEGIQTAYPKREVEKGGPSMRAVGITQAAVCRENQEEEERERKARCVIARPGPHPSTNILTGAGERGKERPP